MAEPEEIQRADRTAARAPARPLAGRRVVVSAGGTREPLDAVRYVGNRSSGRMGVALAEEAGRRGADVTLLAANLAVPAPAGISLVETPTAADLEREALERADADVIVMAAAVADYRPAAPLEDKRPKDGATGPWLSSRRPTCSPRSAPDDATGRCSSGFAADRGDAGLERAREKRVAKNADLFVFNDVSRSDIGFDAPDNEVVVVSERGERHDREGPEDRDRGGCSRRGGAATLGRMTDAAARGGAASQRARLRRSSSASWRTSNARVRAPRDDARAVRPLPHRGGAPHHRGLPGRGEDDAREVRRPLARPVVLAPPVHSGPAADGRDRRERLQPALRRVRVPPGPGLRQRAPRRRDQPRVTEDAVRTARGDAGGAGDDRR